MSKTDNNLVVSLFETLKNRRLSVPKLSELIGIPKERIYKWKQEGTTPKAEDQKKINAWLNGENMEKVPRATVSEGNGDAQDNATLLRILDNISASHREISESNNKLAENEALIIARIPIVGDGQQNLEGAYATLKGVREFVIELYADVKKTTPHEAEAVLGKKVVDAKKKIQKKDNPVDQDKLSK